MQNLVGLKTRVENLHRKVVVPGFIDSHVHLIFGGLQVLRMHILTFITFSLCEKYFWFISFSKNIHFLFISFSKIQCHLGIEEKHFQKLYWRFEVGYRPFLKFIHL